MAGGKYIQLMELNEDHTHKVRETLKPEEGINIKPKEQSRSS